MPGTIIKCESGRVVAFYEHRPDIIANGENEKDARQNLRKMYSIIIKHEEEQEAVEKSRIRFPQQFNTKHFSDKV